MPIRQAGDGQGWEMYNRKHTVANDGHRRFRTNTPS